MSLRSKVEKLILDKVLTHGITSDEVVRLLGHPDSKGLITKKYPIPSFWKYDEIQFSFNLTRKKEETQYLNYIYIDGPDITWLLPSKKTSSFVDTALEVRKSLKNLDLAKVMHDLLLFGSETPDNLEAAKLISVVKQSDRIGLGFKDTKVLLSDFLHELEDSDFSSALMKLNLDNTQAEAALRVLTLIMLAFENRVK